MQNGPRVQFGLDLLTLFHSELVEVMCLYMEPMPKWTKHILSLSSRERNGYFNWHGIF